MNGSKFVLILKTFSRKELDLFDKFIISPVYNKAGVYVVRFYSEVKKFYPEFDSDNFTRENIFRELYPGRRYNDGTFRKLSSELMNLCEEFLIFINFNKSDFDKKRILLEELGARKIDKLFEIKLKESFKILQNDKLKDSEYYFNKFRLISLTKEFYFNRDRKKAIGYFNDETESFVNYFILFMIHLHIERLKEKRNYTDTDFYLEIFDELNSFIKSHDPVSGNAYNIFSAELQLFLEGKDPDYFRLKELKNKYYKLLPSEELNSLYTTLVNFATERYENGNKDFLKEIFELYRESLKRKIIGRYFSEFQFVNIVTIYLQLNEIKLAEKFIKDYPMSLNPDVRENVTGYCNAKISFAKKNYVKSLSYLVNVNFKQIQLKFLVKNLTIKSYYELGQYDSIYSLIDSYKHILKREKLVPKPIRDLIGNFIRFIKEMCDLNEGKGDRSEILQRVKKSATAEKLWLTEKLSSKS